MIFSATLKLLTKSADLARRPGKDISDKKFTPYGCTNHAASNALKNATENNKLVKSIGGEKLLTENVVNREGKAVTIDRNSLVYEAKAVNNLDKIDNEVLKYASAADDQVLHQQMRVIIACQANNPEYENVVEKNFESLEYLWEQGGGKYDRFDEIKLKVFAARFF